MSVNKLKVIFFPLLIYQVFFICLYHTEALTEISSQTGILLDRVYTLKAVKGMLALLNQYPTRLKGSRVLFIHTGGMHSLFDGQLDDVLKTSRETNKVYQLKEFVDYE